MKKYIQIYLFILLFGFIASCKGQTESTLIKPAEDKQQSNLFEHDPFFIEANSATTSFGPTSITRNILQDKKGNIWLATWHGIMRYDGHSFTNFTIKDSLSPFRAFALLEDSNDNIWITTIGAGVYRFDGKSFIQFTTNDGLPNNRVTNAYEDKKGDIWFSTEGGASWYDGTSFHNLVANEGNTNNDGNQLFPNFQALKGLTSNDLNSIIEDKNGVFWFGTRGSACFYDGKTFTEFKNEEGKPFTNVRSIIEDRNGNIWLGGRDGLWRYDGSSFTNFTTDFVGYIYEDTKGNIWTGSDENNHGNWILSKYDQQFLQSPKEAKVTQLRPQRGMLFGLSEDKDGNIWIGSLKGAIRYNGIYFDYFEDTNSKK